MLNLKSILGRLSLKQNELAALIGVHPRTVSLWSKARVPIPGPVAAYLRLLEAAGPRMLQDERAGLDRRSRGMEDGIYTLSYRAANGDGCGSGLAVLKNGTITGSDREGGNLTGSYEFHAATSQNRVQVRFEAPRNGQLVTGIEAGPHGAAFDIAAEFQRAGPVSMLTVDLAGQPVDVEIGYLGPLPSLAPGTTLGP